MAKVECELVTQDAIDVEIGGSAGVLLQAKSVEVTENGTAVVKPDDGFDGLQLVEINTNTPKNITGAIGAPDGISIAQLICSTAASSVTEIVDTNVGWTMTKRISFKDLFPNINKVHLGCGEIQVPFDRSGGVVFGSDEEYKFTALKKITPSTAGGFGHGIFNGDIQSHDIDLGDTEEIAKGGFFGLIRCLGTKTDYRYALIARKLRKCSSLFSHYRESQIGITKVVLGKIETNNFQPYYIYVSAVITPNLIHWEFGKDTAVSLNLQHWKPTNALDASMTDLIEEGSTAENNLQQFLSNFKTYIAERLTDKGTGLTLTLSQEVRNAIHAAEDEYGIENIIITKKGWTISPAPN